MATDYYSTLGVPRDASQDDIRKAYKRLAKQYHPDISKEKEAEHKFKEVQQAYSVIGNEQKRRNYDQFGSASEKFGGFGGFDFGGFSHQEFDFGDIFRDFGFGDTFSDLFGAGSGRGGGPVRGEDIPIRMNVPFEEAVFGAEKEIVVEGIEECGVCSGSGAKPGTKIVNCGNCNGTGIEKRVQKTILGIISTQRPCSRCRGAGKRTEENCTECRGAGRVRKRKTLKIKIPAGIDTGNHLRLRGQGNAGDKGGGAGDVIILIYAEPHELFKRDGSDIFMEVPVSFSEAALGSSIEVPTLKGKAEIKVPAGTQTGTIFKMRGRGIKKLSSTDYGDQFVKVILKTPEKIDREQKKLFEELGKLEGLAKKRENIIEKLRKKFSK
jgi:molecular chaperone DnaJ